MIKNPLINVRLFVPSTRRPEQNCASGRQLTFVQFPALHLAPVNM